MIILPSLLGLALCLLNAGGAELFCLTTGCSLYAGYALFGLSFNIYGAIGFGVISLLAVSAGKLPRASILLGWVIFIGLALDLLFLGWQILYWPCSSCLVIALLLGWTAAAFWRTYPQLQRRCFKGVLLAWLVVFIPVAFATGKEVFLSPWAIYGPPEASIHVYFSPTCSACATEVQKLLESRDVASMAFYPVAKNDRDLRLLASLVDEGVVQPKDLGKIFLADSAETLEPSLRLRWLLARNKMALARYGAQTIPFITSPKVIEGARAPWENLLSPEPASTTGPSGCGAFEQQELSCE